MLVKIKFNSDRDRINGFYELATKVSVRSLPNDIFEILDYHLRILDDAGIPYQRLDKHEKKKELDKV